MFQLGEFTRNRTRLYMLEPPLLLFLNEVLSVHALFLSCLTLQDTVLFLFPNPRCLISSHTLIGTSPSE